MTDFLSALADRALDRAPVLQRRRPSLFERAPGTAYFEQARPDDPWPEISEEINPGLQGRQKAPDFRNIAPKSFRDRADDSAFSYLKRQDPETIYPNGPPLPAIRPQVERPLGESKERVTIMPTREDRAAIGKEKPVREIETIIERVVEISKPLAIPPRQPSEKIGIPSNISLPTVQPVRPQLIGTLQSDLISERKPRRDEAEKHNGQAVSAKPANPIVELGRQIFSNPATAIGRAQAAVAREPQPPAPVIQVTIGRIEVRATSPPAAPLRTAKPAAPTLSLEDYLKSRAGGDR